MASTSQAAVKLEPRVAALEATVEQLQRKLELVTSETGPWWEHIVGAFADDPAFEEAMRLGREYRESLRPKPRTKAIKRAKAKKG